MRAALGDLETSQDTFHEFLLLGPFFICDVSGGVQSENEVHWLRTHCEEMM